MNKISTLTNSETELDADLSSKSNDIKTGSGPKSKTKTLSKATDKAKVKPEKKTKFVESTSSNKEEQPRTIELELVNNKKTTKIEKVTESDEGVQKKPEPDSSSNSSPNLDLSSESDPNSDLDKAKPFIYPFTARNKNIFDYDPEPEYSNTSIDYPALKYGYQHFIHEAKQKTEIFNSFPSNKQSFRVINPYERYIDNYKESMGNIIKLDPPILSRAYYKIWELFKEFPLIDPNNKNFRSAHLAEGPGSFIQATINYRDTKSKHSKNDKYFALTLHSESNQVPDLEKNFIKHFEKEKPLRFIQHKTHTEKASLGDEDKDNGDLINPKTAKLFIKDLNSEKMHLVTGDGGCPWLDESCQEQEAFKLIFGQMYIALSIQETGGAFVLKIFETYSRTTIKFINLMQQFYDKVYITKPLTSRGSNSEKYLVCLNYTPNKKYLKQLEQIYDSNYRNKGNLVNIFPEYEPSEETKKQIITVNTMLGNKQFEEINKMITFINKKDYFGAEYTKYRETQIDAHKLWLSEYK